jgi:pimeloyl-ACP methyl ester carboxylesterase
MDLGARSPCRTVEVDGVRLAMRDTGRGVPVLCLHAVGHGARDFEALADALSPSHRVLALDLPGHGGSSSDPEPPSYARYVHLLDGVITALELPNVVLVGNSVGGGIAIAYASRHPERVLALVLADPAGLVPVNPIIRFGTWWMASFFASGRWGGAVYRALFGAYYRLVLRSPHVAEARARVVRASNALATITARVWRTFGTPQADLRACADAIACPVLIAWARTDLLVRLAPSRPAIARFRDAELVLFAGGHAPFLEHPADFLPVVRRFLARVSTTRE